MHRRRLLLPLLFAFSLSGGNSFAQENPTESEQPGLQLPSPTTDQLQASLDKLSEGQESFMLEVRARFLEIETKLGALQDLHSKDKGDSTEDVDARVSRLHQQHHAEELERLRTHHRQLNSSLAEAHGHLSHLATMHNITKRLELTAHLVLHERWYEALLHWTFAENHLVHGLDSDAHHILSQYLGQVIGFAYRGQSSSPTRLPLLMSLFQFIHKLSSKEYKVYAYETLINQMLTNDDVFDGSEIFILAQHVRRSLGVNSKAQRYLPEITKIVGSGGGIHLIYLGPAFNGTLQELRLSRAPNPNKRRFRRAGKGKQRPVTVPPTISPSTNTNNTLDLHTRAEKLRKQKDVLESLEYPVYGSRNYRPYFSGSWTLLFRNSSFFSIQNGANSGFLNVPSPSEESPSTLLNCVLSDDPYKNPDTEFSFFYLDEVSFGLQAARLKKPLVLTDCVHPEDDSATASCFTVQDSEGDRKGQWTGARFSALPTQMA